MNFVEQGHLGGYILGGDEATYYPDLWNWIVSVLSAKTILDVGCGDGVAVDFFNKLGAHTTGVEGVPQSHPNIIQHDYTIGKLQHCVKGATEDGYKVHGLNPEYDVIWCCEFVEHVEEQFVPNFLDTFSRAQLVFMTHAQPGQSGYHHVNCQPASYWIQKMQEIGYDWDVGLTKTARLKSASNKSPWNHFLRSGLAFRRREWVD